MRKSVLKSENYIAIQGWMIKDLHLKGNELIVYAVIYGFSQTKEQLFCGSLQYLADWTNSTKQGVLKVLKSLQEKQLIIKKENYINGVKFCQYSVTELNGIKQSLTPPIKQSLPNNIEEDNIDIGVSEEQAVTSDEQQSVSRKRTPMKPPTIEEVTAYAQGLDRVELAQEFFDFYELSEWKTRDGKKVKDWQLSFRRWIFNHDKWNNENEGRKRTYRCKKKPSCGMPIIL